MHEGIRKQGDELFVFVLMKMMVLLISTEFHMVMRVRYLLL